jgi:hypothetical protein
MVAAYKPRWQAGACCAGFSKTALDAIYEGSMDEAFRSVWNDKHWMGGLRDLGGTFK